MTRWRVHAINGVELPWLGLTLDMNPSPSHGHEYELERIVEAAATRAGVALARLEKTGALEKTAATVAEPRPLDDDGLEPIGLS